VFDQYWEHCSKALKDFYDRNWPCDYTSDRINRCGNLKGSHGKYHQTKHADLEGGSWLCSQTLEMVQESVKTHLRQELVNLAPGFSIQGEESNSDQNYLHEVYRSHKTNLDAFYGTWEEGDLFKSHANCFSCLLESPEHVLPCGHILCTPCITGFGMSLGAGFIRLDSCPLIGHRTGWNDSQYLTSIKPDQAGLRVLSLDG
jgi:hypothetical protein